MGRERGGFRGRRRGPRPPRGRRPYRPTEFSQRLDSDADRMSLLTGESDPQYGRYSYQDREDRDFNRQFDESPRGRQPWDSDPRGNPLERDPLEGYDTKGGRDVSRPTGRGIGSLGNVPPRVDSRPPRPKRDWWNEPKRETRPSRPPEIPEDERVYAGGSSPIEGVSGHDYLNDPKYRDQRQEKYDDSAIKQRLRDLENRKPQITPATQDLSGITGRLSELEGRKPQDLSGITGRLSELEGRQTSWQEDRIKALEERKPDTSWKDPLSTLQTGQRQGQEARTALDTRLAALEDYYKKDPPPPPEERLGSRYEDKQAQLNKMWEQTGNVYDPEAFARGNPWQKTKDDPSPSWLGEDREGDYVRNKDYYGTGYGAEKSWASRLPETYRKQMRDLDKEYNKPSHSAIIKGREYTAYGPAASARLKYLDQHNIHEDEYLGHGTWQNKFGEEVTGWGKSGNEKRYFTSHSGLDPEGEEYAKRFRREGVYGKTDDGKDTNLYQRSKAGTLKYDDSDYTRYWDAIGGYQPERHGKYGWGVVGTNRSKTGQTKWDEAYYPELG